jgi:riboflavin kinase/FMN adenylyltransferase
MILVPGFARHIDTHACTLTVGVFDGMHHGHETFLRRMADDAHARGQLAVVVTFDPHPDEIVQPDSYRGLLLTPTERYQRIAACGIDVTHTIAFDASVRAMTAAEFMVALCEAMPVKQVWVGWDFALGRGRDGTLTKLRALGEQLGYEAVEVTQIGDSNPPSASFVRETLQNGAVDVARVALGRPHSYTGVVVHGDKRGRTIGFPTANISIDHRLVLPRFGVYASHVTIDAHRYLAVTNIGVRPTFGGNEPRIEAHLLDVTVDVYDRMATLTLEGFIRGEQRFAGLDALKTQIAIDAQSARDILRGLYTLS